MNKRTFVTMVALFFALPFLASASIDAATISVTNTNSSGAGSLAQAIAGANPGDTIDFDLPLSGPATITGNFVIDKNLTIVGPGARSLIVTSYMVGGTVFFIGSPSGSTVSISGITLEGAIVGEPGVGIRHGGYGTLDLREMVIRECETAIVGYSITNIDRSTIHDNGPLESSIDWWPGAITNFGVMHITNSTVSDNVGGIGLATGGSGGIYNYSGVLTITNSTIANNTGVGAGGIYHYGFDNGTLNIRNSIVALNTALSGSGGPDIFEYTTPAPSSLGNNLIGINEGSISFPSGSPNVNGDYVGTLASPLDAMLGPLQNNGGPTDTRAVTETSIAFGNGNNCVIDLSCFLFNPPWALVSDQRGTGFSRLSGANVDIGAFEVRVDPDERIEDLITLIRSYNPRLPFGTETSLVAKLRSALIELSAGDEAAAIQFLYDFNREVGAQRGKKLTEAQAEELLTAVEVILTSLS